MRVNLYVPEALRIIAMGDGDDDTESVEFMSVKKTGGNYKVIQVTCTESLKSGRGS